MILEATDLRGQLSIELCEKFAAESLIDTAFDYVWFTCQYQKLIDTGVAKLWVAEIGGEVVGALGAIQSPHLFSGLVNVMETFWFIDKEHRNGMVAGKLYKKIEAWASELKAQYLVMAHLESLTPTRLGEFYEHQGFKRLETHYAKPIWRGQLQPS